MRFGYAHVRTQDNTDQITEAQAREMLGTKFDEIVTHAREKGVGLIYGVKRIGDYVRAEAESGERTQQY